MHVLVMALTGFIGSAAQVPQNELPGPPARAATVRSATAPSASPASAAASAPTPTHTSMFIYVKSMSDQTPTIAPGDSDKAPPRHAASLIFDEYNPNAYICYWHESDGG